MVQPVCIDPLRIIPRIIFMVKAHAELSSTSAMRPVLSLMLQSAL